MTGVKQIARHRSSHVAKTNESNTHEISLLLLTVFVISDQMRSTVLALPLAQLNVGCHEVPDGKLRTRWRAAILGGKSP